MERKGRIRKVEKKEWKSIDWSEKNGWKVGLNNVGKMDVKKTNDE